VAEEIMQTGVQTTRDDFEYWLADMGDALDRFLESLPREIRSRLDYSIESLDALESWILSTYPDSKDMLPMEESTRVGGAARYIGQTIRKNIGGHWDINLDRPHIAFYGIPIVTGFSPTPTPMCPLAMATSTANRRTGTYLRTILENMKRSYGAKGNK
jgi:hypothetical protein